MGIPAKQNNELNGFFNQRQFVESTVAQINKDLLGLSYADFVLHENNEFTILENLIRNLQPILLELSKRQPEQLSQFIYRVDLPEKKFHSALAENQSFEKLAYLIIEREAQKVFLRQKFS